MGRTRLGRPLSPELIGKTGDLGDFPPRREADFRPDGNWTHTYRIWGTHGYFKDRNYNTGYLKICRKSDAGGGRDAGLYGLSVEQKIVNDEGFVNRLDADMLCRQDRIGTPLEWRLGSRLTDPEGEPMTEL